MRHRKGVIHRDLKPGNVLIDAQNCPRVTDFGLAKKLDTDSSLTLTGCVMGTPSYMPPEQAAGHLSEVGPASDIYALGALLYCLLTGRPPFQASTPVETLRQVIEDEPVPPRALNGATPGDLQTIVLKCLQKDRRRRCESAQAGHGSGALAPRRADQGSASRAGGTPRTVVLAQSTRRRAYGVDGLLAHCSGGRSKLGRVPIQPARKEATTNRSRRVESARPGRQACRARACDGRR